IPYFRLTRISDRWGRTLDVSWNTFGVQSVTDGDGRGLTFQYAGHLISSITDPAGRTHSLTRTLVNGQSRLTGVSVQGAGSPDLTAYSWHSAYGGEFQALVVTKTEPSGKVVHYEYEPVNVPRQTADDWDGRCTRTWFLDDLDNQPRVREIRRQGTKI